MNRLLAFLAVSLAALSVHADNLPAKAVRFIVPYPPGGSVDAVARILAASIAESTKQVIIVENKAGAGGNIGADAVAKSAPDGNTILMGAVATHAINPSLYADMPYDAQKDFIAVTQVAATPNVLVLNPGVPARDVKELIAYAKANPGKLNFASGSNGSAGHLAGELFKSLTGTDMTHVPYKGAAPAMTDLLSGQVQLMFDNLASSMQNIKAGKLRALAVTTASRSALMPELPTLDEAGVKGFDISTWLGIFVPAGTPGQAVARIHAEFTSALASPDVRGRMLLIGAEPVGSTPEQFAAYIRSESLKYARVIKASGARVD
jgi:tripartite-type tricarboxylate transporter receptor subunit TctC